MTEPVIKVENLGKRYTLGLQGTRAPYTTLRETVSGMVSSGWRRLHSKTPPGPKESDFWALRDVNFDVQKGEIIGIIGRNGAGKSTLLKILTRITDPTEGRVTVIGRVASLLEVGTGFHPELTGRENIYLNGAILGMARTEIKAKFDEIVAFSEVEKFLDTPVKRYSSGMYVRLAFAVAAHLEPEILIVDEVLAVGDAEFQKRCLGKMQEVAEGEGRTVFFVSHNMSAIHQLCTRALLLAGGALIKSGQPLDVIDTYLHTAAESGFAHGKRYEESVWISDAKTLDAQGKPTNRFPHHDPIRLALDCTVAHWVPGANVGMVLKDGKDRVVFRSEQDFPTPPTTTLYPLAASCEATIPGDLLIPGRYLLTLFVHVPLVRMLFLADDALVLNIIDAGSPFARYEGKADCGCIFVDCRWRIDFP